MSIGFSSHDHLLALAPALTSCLIVDWDARQHDADLVSVLAGPPGPYGTISNQKSATKPLGSTSNACLTIRGTPP